MSNPHPHPPLHLHLHLHPHSSILFLLLILSSLSLQSISSATATSDHEWQILTSHNFSSQIRLNPHILLIVTVPWSGEARSLMKELADVVSRKKEEFRTLKLMLVHKNKDKMLADALGAKMELNVICYHNSFPYKYQGAFRVQNILSSVRYLMSLSPAEIPFKSLSTTEDITTFLKSADRALLVLEFCGWTPKLMAKVMNNGSENISGVSIATGLFGERGETSAIDGIGKKNQEMQNEKITCNIDQQFNELPGLGEFIPLNESDFREAKKMESSDEDPSSCSFEEFQLFESSLFNLTNFARELFLPPERLKFGFVTERSLISSLGVADTRSWLIMQYSSGCPSCAKVYKEGSDLKKIIEMNASPVMELKSDEYDFDPGLPSDKPSVLLFIDRSSDSLKIRRKSKESLNVLRELALHHYIPSKMDTQNIVNQAHVSRIVSHHPKLEMSTLSQKVTQLKDKITIITMNEDKHITFDDIASNLQGNSLQDVLAYVLQQKKQRKLSSLAKDVGFQLLSDDIDITMSEIDVQSDEKLTRLSMKDLSGTSVKFEKEQASHVDELEHSGKDDEKISVDTSVQSVSNFENEDVEKGSNCTFFFVDGQFRLLEALTGALQIPSLVIINPISHQHYVYPGEDFAVSSVSTFLHMFLNESLLPYQRSKSLVHDTKKAPRPPFVNQDFLEVDSIPRVNAFKFKELVVGNHSDSLSPDSVWKKDVLVLFSSSWCGFCMRTELVLREVYRAFKGYGDMVKSQFRDDHFSSGNDDINDTMMKLPLIYMMDCIENDCSLLLKSSTKRDLYPSVLLYPAERKEAILYDGELSVLNIIKFIADQGGNSYWIYKERGTLWTEAENGAWNEQPFKDVPEHVMQEENHEILLKDRPQTQTQKLGIVNDKIGPRTPYDSSGSRHEIIPGSILVATQKLDGINPFTSSKILIVKVNQTTGFQGLIINKLISWDSITSLEEGLDSLKHAPLSYGGPVITRELPLVSLTRQSFKDDLPEVLPDIYFLDQLATINLIRNLKLDNRSMTDYWFFVGYSAWDWNQLFDEIAGGSWNLINGTVQQFDWPMT